MRKLFALILFIGSTFIGTSQVYTGDVSLTSQAEVDAFVAAQPGTTTIAGMLHLNFSSPGGFDLSALNTLQEIDRLEVEGYLNVPFESFTNQLTSINSGNITFSACIVEIPLTVFSAISSCSKLELNATGESLTFPSLTSIGQILNTETSTSICSFPLVNSLNRYDIKSPVIWQFPTLTHVQYLRVFPNIDFPEYSALLLGMEAITSADTIHFGNLLPIHFEVNPLLNIQEVNNLNLFGYTFNHLDPLVANLNSINRLEIVVLREESVIPHFPANIPINRLILWSNFYITEMDGLADVQFIESIYIEHNDALQVCNVPSVCSFLASDNEARYIAYNKLGCNSLNEVTYACEHPNSLTLLSGQLFIDLDCNGEFDGSDINCGINPLALYTSPEFIPATTVTPYGLYTMAIPLNSEVTLSSNPLIGFDTQNIPINSADTPQIIENLNLSICPTTDVHNIGVNTFSFFQLDEITWRTNLVVTNYSATIESGDITFTFTTPLVDGYLYSQSQNAIGNTLTIHVDNLLPFETRTFIVYPNYSSNYTPGDPLPFTCAVLPSSGIDSDWTNNQLSGVLYHPYSYDPNEIVVNRSQIHFDDVADGQPEELVYTVRFQNTGTAPAYNVRVRDVLSADLDISSIEMIEASDNYYYTIIGDTLTWYFDNILLPDSNQNEPGSHGWLSFKIKTRGNHTINSVIENNVAIYFDLNEPVITNTAQTTFYDCLPEFTITGDIEACAGTSAVYTLPEENYTSIDWIVNGESVSSANSLEWSFLTESTTTIEVEAFTELCAYTHSIEVMTHPTPSFDVTVWGTSISTFPAQESYMWYFEDQLIAEATSSQYNATESGNYAVVGFNEFGCYQNSSINFALCPPIPTIEGNTYFCGSQFQSLYTSMEYPNMDWYLDGQYFGFGVEFFGAINTPGTHTITISVGNDLCMTDNEIEVVASGLPQISLSDGVISTDFIGEFYQWYLNDNPIDGATTNTVNVSGAGFYTVVVTVGDECAVESDNIFIPLDVAESIETPIQLYPNPFADQLQLNLPATFILPGSVRIMNATGQLIFQTTITSTQQMLELNALPSGMYLMEVIDERGHISIIKAEKE